MRARCFFLLALPLLAADPLTDKVTAWRAQYETELKSHTGWLSVARSQSWHTPRLLREAGVRYCGDWVNDELLFRAARRELSLGRTGNMARSSRRCETAPHLSK